MNKDYSWLNRRYDRSVNQLRLWDENPRLDPSDSYIYLRDFIEGMLIKEADKTSFIDLAQSIVEKSFIPADPIVVWQNRENNRFYVAEGNRRVAVLKLLLDPTKAPKSIKRSMELLSKKIKPSLIEKIPVAIAPSFEDAIWYINQRHTPSSNQKKWVRENYLKWIGDLYEKFNKDIEVIKEYTDVTESELNNAICVLKFKELFADFGNRLTTEELTEAKSKRFPISTLERFICKDFVQKKMGFYFSGTNIILNAKYESFLDSLSVLIKRMLLPKKDSNRLDSRQLNTNEDINKILEELPIVEMKENPQEKDSNISDKKDNKNSNSDNKNQIQKENQSELALPIDDPNRKNVIPSIYSLTTVDYRLHSLFLELKKLPVKSYPNIAAASIRIFLDIAVRNYIVGKGWESAISTKFKCDFKNVKLSGRLDFIKDKISQSKSKKAVTILLDANHMYSLDTLNGYIHGSDNYTINRQFINSFWNFLFPLFEEILDIHKEEE